MSNTPENLRNSIYRIFEQGPNVQPQNAILTTTEQAVTLTGKDAVPEREQEWHVEATEGGTAIHFPAVIIPSAYISYKEPSPGERIILGPMSDFPTRIWNVERLHIEPMPESFVIRVPNSVLTMAISKVNSPSTGIYIHLTYFVNKNGFPQLELGMVGVGEPSAWAFEFLRD